MTKTEEAIRTAVAPMHAAITSQILDWITAQANRWDDSERAGIEDMERFVRATPLKMSPWNSPEWLSLGGRIYAATVEDAIKQGRKLIGPYALAVRESKLRGGRVQVLYAGLTECRAMSKARDRLPEVARERADAVLAAMIAKMVAKLSPAGDVASAVVVGSTPDFFTLKLRTESGREISVETNRITNFRGGRPYWQWPSRISEMVQGEYRQVAAARLGESPAKT